MATNALLGPKARFFDANGDPLSGGKLYTYSAGTSTPLATYTTRAGSVANANPVVLDANGEADIWFSPGVDYKLVLKNSADVTQWTVDNLPSPGETAATDDVSVDPGGRLTISSLTPVTTSDVTAGDEIYYSPYKHNKVPLYDGSSWSLYTISDELSQTTADSTKSPAAVVANSNYDLFVWNDSGSLRLSRGPAWTSATARGTGAGTTQLTRVDGRYVNAVSITNGPGAQRGLYVGSVRSNSSSEIDDTLATRFVWNMYNRVPRSMRVFEATATWSYATATWRQARGSTANQLAFLIGLSEDTVEAHAHHIAGNDSGSLLVHHTAIGLDSTSAIAAAGLTGSASSLATNDLAGMHARWSGLPGLGYHYLAWLERGPGSGNTTWYGTSATVQTGIHGEVLA